MADLSNASENAAETQIAADAPLQYIYSCKKCRAPLFKPEHIESHELGQDRFSYHQKLKGNVADHFDHRLYDSTQFSNPVCTSFFLKEALKWMEETSENVEGKLNCYKCKTRIGTLKWQGGQCSCGTWITPAIQITKKSIDQRIVQSAPPQ